MEYRILFLFACLVLYSCEEAPESQTKEYSATIDSLAWHPNAFPTGGKIKLSLSEDFETTVFGANENLFEDVFYTALQWDDAVGFINFFNPEIDIVKNLDYEDPNSYWDEISETQIGIYRSTNWFEDIPSEAVAITQYHAIAENHNGEATTESSMPISSLMIGITTFQWIQMINKIIISRRFFCTSWPFTSLGHTFEMSSGSIMIPGFGSSYQQNLIARIDKNNIYRKYAKFKPSSSNLNFMTNFNKSNDFKSLKGKQIRRFIQYLIKDHKCKIRDHTH